MTKTTELEEFKSVFFIEGADPRRFYNLWSELRNSMIKCHNNYPVSVVQAFNVFNICKGAVRHPPTQRTTHPGRRGNFSHIVVVEEVRGLEIQLRQCVAWMEDSYHTLLVISLVVRVTIQTIYPNLSWKTMDLMPLHRQVGPSRELDFALHSHRKMRISTTLLITTIYCFNLSLR